MLFHAVAICCIRAAPNRGALNHAGAERFLEVSKRKTSISLPSALIERLEEVRQRRAVGRYEPPTLADVMRDMMAMGLAQEMAARGQGEQR